MQETKGKWGVGWRLFWVPTQWGRSRRLCDSHSGPCQGWQGGRTVGGGPCGSVPGTDSGLLHAECVTGPLSYPVSKGKFHFSFLGLAWWCAGLAPGPDSGITHSGTWATIWGAGDGTPDQPHVRQMSHLLDSLWPQGKF